MKKRMMIALIVVIVLALGAVGVFAIGNYASADAVSLTARFNLVDSHVSGDEFSMVSEDGTLTINITNSTPIYFEGYVPLSDECEELTRDAREVLFGRTVAEVLEGRNLRVVFVEGAQAEPISVTILFETFMTLPEVIDLEDLDFGYDGIVTVPDVILEYNGDGYVGIVTLPGEVVFGEDWDDIILNGEIVVNNEILDGAALPFWQEVENGNVVMIPLEIVAEALEYDVSENADLGSIQLGVAIHIWIGSTEAHLGRMAPIELSTAPVIVDDVIFVPMDFFRDVLGQTVYVFEGQVVVETYSDMM